MRKFRDSQIVIITNYVVVSSAGLKRVVCTLHSYTSEQLSVK